MGGGQKQKQFADVHYGWSLTRIANVLNNWMDWMDIWVFLGFLFETVTQAYEPRTPKSRPRPLRIKLVDPEKNKGIKIVEKHLNII